MRKPIILRIARSRDNPLAANAATSACLDPERLRSLTGVVCIKLLTRLRRNPTYARPLFSLVRNRRSACVFAYCNAATLGVRRAQDNNGEFVMNISSKILAAALMAAAAPWLVAPAAAAPISLLGLQNAAAPSVETVQYRRSWRGGYRNGISGGAGVGLGLAAGAIVGGAIIGATQPYGYRGYSGYDGYAYDQGYAYAPGYDQGYVAVSPYTGGSEVAFCRQRFRSYDPASGTYLGFDGLRHPCP